MDADGGVTLHYSLVDPTTDAGCIALCHDNFANGDFNVRVTACTVSIADGGVIPGTRYRSRDVATVSCQGIGAHSGCMGGRHHFTLLRDPVTRSPASTAAWLAREALAEAGSVLAFRRLAAELTAHGAPVELVARCLDAARDERRHARSVGRLARARGAVIARVRARAPRVRPLMDLAIENAVEGCVHETWAALRVAWQSLHARDADVRAVCAQLAVDEARHADLASDLHAWLASRLSAHENERVVLAQRDAWQRVITAPSNTRDTARIALGVPDGPTARALTRALASHLHPPT